jgi:hypothetical protein
MASWKKHFTPVTSRAPQTAPARRETGSAASGAKYSSYLPEVYSGAPNRVERYIQYEQMDLDSEINKGLDIIADYSTQNYEKELEPFDIIYKDTMSETEVKLLKDMLGQWCSLNKWQQRLWRLFRNTIKYGDQIYIRDPETFKLIWVDPTKVEKIIVNEARGKEIEQYVIRDLDINLMSLVGTNMLVHDQYSFPGGYPRSSNPAAGAGTINYGVASSPGSRTSRFDNMPNQIAIDATHVVHLSLSEGMDSQWPFGTSLLESIYKVYKQKDLLEDSILIYRIVRAPERRVFYIDTGNLSGPRAQSVVERMKNEIYQRRIPSRTGGGQSILDASYSPIAINEDYFLATNSDGKGTRIETLPGGENLGQIDDLKYFNNKLIRGLGIPSSYLPTGPDDGATVYTDGKVGTAYVQEFRFAKYCQRLQNQLVPGLDREFKLYIKSRGIEIESNTFELKLWEPQSFAQYRQMALDTEQITVFSGLMQTDAAKYISKRFAMMRYLGWSEEDILKNEEMYKQENAKRVKDKIGISNGDDGQPGLTSVGIRPSAPEELETGMEPPPEGEPSAPSPPGGSAPQAGAEPAAPAPTPGGP